ncbi:WD40 repeat domain-containing protein [Methylacidimicrobium sp. B4]|uniref:WD40 repeat domain-containing protein n=1 Tax=Methylacidimicrobium sp. B4 TaxID=2796139 RepID=UPI001A8D383E|nr:WD40 repeat domain-containing protein [Methylacidimicrobium sp. B4]QSR85677.1 WD40 repeat domain-containing protein [Methylacidimicrobium sp. B4]
MPPLFRRKTLPRFATALAWLVCAGQGFAIHPQRIVLDTYSDFALGTAEGVTVCDAGLLQPAPSVELMARLPADQLWTILPEGGGSVLVATSPEAKIFRIGQHREATLLASFREHQLYAMARGPKGELFAATSPNGKIYLVPEKGAPVVYFDPKEKYIWSLLFDRDGILYAGTGTGGKIYRVEGPQKGSLFCTTGETHVRCLAWERPGVLLAGSAPRGLLLRVLPGGRAVALADSEREEVNQIVVSSDGSVFFSAVGIRHAPRAPGSSPEPGAAATDLGTSPPEAAEFEEPQREPGRGLPLGMIKIAAPAPLSQIWMIDRSLVPRTIWGSREVLFSLLQAPLGLLAGTNGDGYLYRISPEGRSDRFLKIDAPSVQVAVATRSQELLLGASNPARVFLAGGAPRSAGLYRSAPLDAGNFARWGRLLVEKTGAVEVRTRTGNSAKPDGSWYEWLPAPDGRCQNPPGRYFQFELGLAQGSSVNRVQAVFLPYNLPPKIEKLQILPPGVAYSELPPPPTPFQARTLDQLLAQEEKPEPMDIFPPMPPRYQAKEARGLRTAVWKAEDLDGDDLRYSVFYRNEKESSWHLLVKDWEEELFSWDTSGWPDGRYLLKIEASDARDNAPGEGLTGSLNSRSFLVDNTPPRIRILSSGEGKLRFRVSEDASGIQTVQISRDGREFLPIPPLDGILDSEEEEFETALAKGETLFIRAEDEAGNVASASSASR